MAGEVIEDPSAIKLFRSRLNTRDVLELSKDSRDLASWISYLEARVPEIDARILDLLSAKIAEQKAPASGQASTPSEVKDPKVPEVPTTPTAPVTPAQVAKPVTAAKATAVKATVKNS